MKKKSRKPTTETAYDKSAVAKLRLITGMTKECFAMHCCLPLNTLKTIESRGHKTGMGLSTSNAYLIAAATGASPGNLMRNQLRAMGTNKSYTKADLRRHISALEVEKDTWQKPLLGVVTDRFDEIMNQLSKGTGVSLLVALFLLASDLDQFSNKIVGIKTDTSGEILKKVREQLSPQFKEQPITNVWRRYALEKSADRMAERRNAIEKEKRRSPSEKAKRRNSRK